ncbi:hypothetical protein FQS88_07025 [Enterococcus casseliflavus]|nr:hypothetical protein [Enterococcus casseliflavus]
MALSGSAYTSFHRHRLVIEWSATQSIPSNNSTVTARVYLQGMDAYSAINAPASNAGSVTVNGTTKSFTASSSISAYQKKLLTTQTFSVGHNADGSKSFNFSTTFNINATLSGTFHGNKTASGSGTLNTIPRAGGVSVTNSGFDYGGNLNFTLSNTVSSFSYECKVSIAGNSTTSTISGGSASGTKSINIPLSWATKVPNATSTSGTLTVTTKSGSSTIGTKTANFTIKVPSSVAPAVSTVTTAETNTTVSAVLGVTTIHIQGMSQLKVTASASGNQGSTIKTYTYKLDGKTFSSSSNSYTIDFAKNGITSGSKTLTVTVSDSRGRSASKTATVTVLAYSVPVISDFSGARSNNGKGNTVLVTRAGSISSLKVGTAEKNTMTVTLMYKKSSETAWTTAQTGTSLADITVSSIAVDSSYDFMLQIKDKFNTSSASLAIPTAFTLLSLNEDKGIGIGKLHEQGVLDVEGESYFNGDVNLGDAGRLKLSPDLYASQGGGMDFNNSDLVGVNGIYIGATRGGQDPANNDGEGLLFPKSGTIIPEDGKIDRTGTWDTFRVMDGVGYLNSKPVFFENADILWSGQSYPVANSGITPKTKLNDCPNGWILVWSDYDADTGKANDSDWHFTFIPKSHNSGGGIRIHVPSYDDAYGNKYIYCTGTQINGHNINSANANAKDVVLRQVVAF